MFLCQWEKMCLALWRLYGSKAASPYITRKLSSNPLNFFKSNLKFFTWGSYLTNAIDSYKQTNKKVFLYFFSYNDQITMCSSGAYPLCCQLVCHCEAVFRKHYTVESIYGRWKNRWLPGLGRDLLFIRSIYNSHYVKAQKNKIHSNPYLLSLPSKFCQDLTIETSNCVNTKKSSQWFPTS